VKKKRKHEINLTKQQKGEKEGEGGKIPRKKATGDRRLTALGVGIERPRRHRRKSYVKKGGLEGWGPLKHRLCPGKGKWYARRPGKKGRHSKGHPDART